MLKKNENFPLIAINLANIVFIIGILFSLIISFYACYRIFNPIYDYTLGNRGIQNFYIIAILFSFLFAGLLGYGLKNLSNNYKINIALFFLSLGLSIYGFETFLEFSSKTEIQILAKQAKKLGVPYDTRTKLEVRDDLRKDGIEALPNMHGYYWMEEDGFKSKEGNIYPLGTVSNSITILHNQSGFYPIVEMDEHGYHNPKGLYVKNNIDIALTGDSFAEGYAVNSDENMSALLRQSKFNTISFGKGGNGPLLEFATLKEYVEPLKPNIVIWLYFANDFNNLRYEMQSSTLRNYLNDENFFQNLISRQDEIDQVLMSYVNKVWKIERQKAKVDNKKREKLSSSHFIKIIKLYNLRTSLNLIPTPTHLKSELWDGEVLPVFKEILKKSNQKVTDWGGKMYFLYMPAYGRYKKDYQHNFKISDSKIAIATAEEFNIPVIDIHKEVFENHPDPLSLFPLRLNAHYTAKGYNLVVEAIIKRLKKDGYIPNQSRN